MNSYPELLEQYNRVRQQLEELILEYEGKIQGDVFLKRKMQLLDKGEHLKKSLMNLGCNGIIYHIQGQRSRPHRKNPQITIKERFHMYFTNVKETEISPLVHLHVKNVDYYAVTFIRPGIIMSTS